MELELFDYHLPPDMIAQSKSEPRDSSRLFYIDPNFDPPIHEHLRFRDILDKLEKGDILVLNRSRVIPARVKAQKETGGKAEVLLLERTGKNEWEALLGGKKIREGATLRTDDPDVSIIVRKRIEEGRCRVYFRGNEKDLEHEDVLEWLKKWGMMPTPPYIKKMLSDPEEYQTVYGNMDGSVAAPTAGLHFTDELLDRIRSKGVEVLFIILHVGIGTFAPVKVEDIEDHRMEEEEYTIPDEVASKLKTSIDDHKKGGKRRIWAVGTTVMRTLESAFDEDGTLVRKGGRTGLYITPGRKFHVPYKGFITNFHLPRSTPLILVSTFYNRERVIEAYEEAKKIGYRFYSLGDSMMIRRSEE